MIKKQSISKTPLIPLPIVANILENMTVLAKYLEAAGSPESVELNELNVLLVIYTTLKFHELVLTSQYEPSTSHANVEDIKMESI